MRDYKDKDVMGLIVEMVNLLSKSPLSVEEREKIINLTLLDTKHDKAVRYQSIGHCRDLLLFDQGFELKGIKTLDQLSAFHMETCRKIFAVKAENCSELTTKFKSNRYPNGLFTYGAGLQKLPATEKELVLEAFSKFVNGYLEGTFPNSRYDLPLNPHLQHVFEGRGDLFRLWREPFSMEVDSTAKTEEADHLKSIKNLMKAAIKNAHLGENQENLYPTLNKAIVSETSEGIEAALKSVSSELKNLYRIDKAAPKKRNVLTDENKKLAKNLHIENFCLQFLNSTDKPKMCNCLTNLCKLLNDVDCEFKNDIADLLKELQAPVANSISENIVESTESWEDLLLMDTEVNNSCQRINGDAHLNKCLLSYILDGKNKAIIVRDANGKIAARSVLRILWDEELSCPVLHMEAIYMSKRDSEFTNAITQGCKSLAKKMGLVLLANSKEGRPYSHALTSLGGPIPFEYVDSSYGAQKAGKYSILNSVIIYKPDEE